MTPARPDFLIIGAVRAGSTALYRYLADHPDVYMAAKEPHFFDKRFEHGLDWYAERFAAGAGARAVGEATPAYMYDTTALDRMAAVVPHARLLAILRNPVDRAYSHYWMDHARDKERRSFAAAVEAEAEGTDGGSGYLDLGRYARHLEEVTRRFPPSQLHVVLFEELRADPAPAYAAVCRFLGVDDGFVPSNLGDHANPYVTFRSLTVRRLTKANRATRTRKLPVPVRRLRALVARVNTRTGVAYPPLGADERARVAAHFEADNRALAAFLGRDLSLWDA